MRDAQTLHMAYGSDLMAQALRDLEVDYVFINPGSSFRGLHDSLVNYLGDETPKMVLATHEMTAVAMAHGYAKATGRTGVCILHNLVGLMNGSMAIFNAFCDQVPMVIFGGSGPADPGQRRFIDWAHSANTQGDLVRPYVKWTDEPASLEGGDGFDAARVPHRGHRAQGAGLRLARCRPAGGGTGRAARDRRGPAALQSRRADPPRSRGHRPGRARASGGRDAADRLRPPRDRRPHDGPASPPRGGDGGRLSRRPHDGLLPLAPSPEPQRGQGGAQARGYHRRHRRAGPDAGHQGLRRRPQHHHGHRGRGGVRAGRRCLAQRLFRQFVEPFRRPDPAARRPDPRRSADHARGAGRRGGAHRGRRGPHHPAQGATGRAPRSDPGAAGGGAGATAGRNPDLDGDADPRGLPGGEG